MKTEKTYKQLFEFQGQISILQKMYNPSPDPVPVVEQNRLLKKALTSHFEDYNEKLEDLKLKFCIRDEKTRAKILTADGGYQFTEDNEKLLRAAVKELNNEVVDVHFNQSLSYQELLKIIDKKSHPYIQWEDVKEHLEPFYHNEP